MKAFHGSCFKFAEFDHAHSGNGNGESANGFGYYFTDEKGRAIDFAKGTFNEVNYDPSLNDYRELKGTAYIYHVEVDTKDMVDFNVGFTPTQLHRIRQRLWAERKMKNVQLPQSGIIDFLQEMFKTGEFVDRTAKRRCSYFLFRCGITGIFNIGDELVVYDRKCIKIQRREAIKVEDYKFTWDN